MVATNLGAKHLLRALALFAVGLAIGSSGIEPAQGHKGAKGVVKQRMDMMKSVSGEMKRIAAEIKRGSKMNRFAIARAARDIRAHADAIPKLFPFGSLGHPSEASPKIWEDWDGFVEILTYLHITTAQLEAKASGKPIAALARGSAAGPDPAAAAKAVASLSIGELYKRVGQTCAACHQKFRVKEK